MKVKIMDKCLNGQILMYNLRHVFFLARSAKLPEGLYILPMFFLYFFYYNLAIFNFCCFRALAYTTLTVNSFFQYSICCFIKKIVNCTYRIWFKYF